MQAHTRHLHGQTHAQVEFKDGLKAKLVFVRNKHKRDWLALLTTNVSHADEDVVRIYGKRWDIEVFFRTAKQHLELEKGKAEISMPS